MRRGGVFDQVGFGFHRYSTDPQWKVPHFEKMLYDQALLALAYTEAFQATRAEKFKLTATEVFEYVLRDLTSPEGGFYAAEDADSEGEEGKFYLWTEKEVRKALPPEDADLAVTLFNVKTAGNYAEAVQKQNGQNILHVTKPLEQIASESQLTLNELTSRLERIQSLLFKAREKRVHPTKDYKILVDWNGLMIAALAKASSIFNEPRYLHAAIKATEFILNKMKDENGMLYHRYAKGEKAVEGFLDDYACLVWGLIEIFEACFEESYLHEATELTEAMILRFWDNKNGGFYVAAEGTEKAVPRIKELHDGAVPSGNSVALLNLLRLAQLTSEQRGRKLAGQMIKVFSGDVQIAPAAHTFMLLGVDFAVGPVYNVILVGELQEDSVQIMLGTLKSMYLPNMTVSVRQPERAGLGYEKVDDKATVYVCRNQTCMPPTNKIEKMREYLEMP
jgi:uncharacterized protein